MVIVVVRGAIDAFGEAKQAGTIPLTLWLALR